MEKLSVPQGRFGLSRYPVRKKETLRAWDAADEYLLNEVADKNLTAVAPRLLILNDGFGALSVALSDFMPAMMSDSYLAQQATLLNLQNNQIRPDRVRLSSCLDRPDGIYDLVLVKIPKNRSLLEDQLFRIRPHINKDTKIIGAGMVKGIHRSTLELFNHILGPTHTSLARKKARLIFCEPDMTIDPGDNPYPRTFSLDKPRHEITRHSNVFSQSGLDIGTRFFIEYIPASSQTSKIIDLGCGNGIIGLVAAELNPNAELLFIDESFMSVESAKATFNAAFGGLRKADYQPNDCLAGIAENSADLVLCNPPFHQHAAIGDVTAWQMFGDAKKVLKRGGELWVVGNRHLAYHVKLKRLFGNYVNIASNNKFVILKAKKR